MRHLRLPVMAGALLASLSACSQQQGRDIVSQFSQGRPQELLQTSVDRMATLSMRDNLRSLYLLMNKLYQRNPNQWRQSGYVDASTAERQIRQAIEQRQPLAQLGERRDLAALSYALSPEFRGDRVGAFIYAIGSMLVTAHGGRTEFFMTDTIDPQFVSNAARNIEKATWLLSQRQDANGVLLLFSNEISEEGSNLSFAVEFGKIVARLDLLAQMLDERYRRIGLNYAQSLLLMNFLPVQ
ncbi:lipoprotein [Pseudomonas sp. 2(2015)]|nr:lipoprotein [Pseudomonas sp. 2(2015)]